MAIALEVAVVVAQEGLEEQVEHMEPGAGCLNYLADIGRMVALERRSPYV